MCNDVKDMCKIVNKCETKANQSLPMGMVLAGFERLIRLPCVPELYQAIIAAGHQVVLTVRVKVQVTH